MVALACIGGCCVGSAYRWIVLWVSPVWLPSKQHSYSSFISWLVATLLIIPIGTNWIVALDLRVVASLIFLVGYVLLFASRVSLSKVTVNITIFREASIWVKELASDLVGILNYRGYLLVLATFSEAESVGYFSIALLFAE